MALIHVNFKNSELKRLLLLSSQRNGNRTLATSDYHINASEIASSSTFSLQVVNIESGSPHQILVNSKTNSTILKSKFDSIQNAYTTEYAVLFQVVDFETVRTSVFAGEAYHSVLSSNTGMRPVDALLNWGSGGYYSEPQSLRCCEATADISITMIMDVPQA